MPNNNFNDIFFSDNLNIQLNALKKDVDLFKYIRVQPKKLVEYAIDKKPSLLKYVVDQTNAICIKAMNNQPYSFRFINNKTPYLCDYAIQQNGYNIKYMNSSQQTNHICNKALNYDPYVIKFIIKPDIDMCIKAVNNCQNSVYLINSIANKIDVNLLYKKLIKYHNFNLKDVPKIYFDRDIFREGIIQNPYILLDKSYYLKQYTLINTTYFLKAIRKNYLIYDVLLQNLHNMDNILCVNEIKKYQKDSFSLEAFECNYKVYFSLNFPSHLRNANNDDISHARYINDVFSNKKYLYKIIPSKYQDINIFIDK